MKTALLLAAAAAAALLFAPSDYAQTSPFPASADSAATLGVPADNVSSALTSPMLVGDTVAQVANGAVIPQWALITFGGELAQVCLVSGNTLTLGTPTVCPSIAGRGLSGTTVAAHATGTIGYLLINGYYHKALSSGLIAAETELLRFEAAPCSADCANWITNISNLPVIDVRGVTNGVVCGSSESSGQRTANNAAIQLAAATANTNGGGTVLVPCLLEKTGTVTVAGTSDGANTNGTHGVHIVGTGMRAATVCQMNSVNAFTFTTFAPSDVANVGQFNSLSDLRISGPGQPLCGTGSALTAGTAITAQDQFNFTVQNVDFEALANDILLTDVSGAHIIDSDLRQAGYGCAPGVCSAVTITNQYIANTQTDYFFHGDVIDCGPTGATNPPLAGIQWMSGGNLSIAQTDEAQCGIGLLIDPGPGQFVQQGSLQDVAFDTNSKYAVSVAPSYSGSGGLVKDITFGPRFWSSTSGTTTDTTTGCGINLNAPSGTGIDGLQFIGVVALNNVGPGFCVNGGMQIINTDLHDSLISGNGRELGAANCTFVYSSGPGTTAVTCASGDGFPSDISGTVDIFSIGANPFPVASYVSATEITVTGNASTFGSNIGVFWVRPNVPNIRYGNGVSYFAATNNAIGNDIGESPQATSTSSYCIQIGDGSSAATNNNFIVSENRCLAGNNGAIYNGSVCNNWSVQSGCPSAAAGGALIDVSHNLGAGFLQAYDYGNFDVRQFNWLRQVPAQNISTGSGPYTGTVTLSPMPLGLNGSDTGHYVYILDTTSGSEPCLITGGSGTSNLLSGSIALSCGIAHTAGNYFIEPVDFGLQEAVNTGPSVTIPSGTWKSWAPAYITNSACVKGAGKTATYVDNQSTTLAVFQFVTPAAFCLRDMQIGAGGISNTSISANSGTAVYVNGNGNSGSGADISNVVIKNHNINLDLGGTVEIYVNDFSLFYQGTYGLRLSGGAHLTHGQISNSGGSGLPATSTGCGIQWTNGGGLYARSVDVIAMPYGVCLQPGANLAVDAGLFTNVLADTSNYHGWLFDASASGSAITAIDCEGCWGGFSGGYSPAALNGNLPNNGTTAAVTVTPSTSQPYPTGANVLFIGTEEFACTSYTAPTFAGCLRAQNGTSYAAHTGTATVWVTNFAGDGVHSLGTNITDVTFRGGFFNTNGGSAFNFTTGSQISLVGVEAGINSTFATGTYPEVNWGAGTSGFSMNGGTLGYHGTFGPPSVPSVGINIATGSQSNFQIDGVNLQFGGSGMGTITNGSTGTGNRITNVRGYNPVGVTTGTVGTSPWTYTNGPTPATFYVKTNGTNISAMTVGGTAIATATTSIALNPNEALVITWSTGAPTYAVDGQ